MRIGLSPGGELATRVSRVLLADPRIERLGVPRPLSSEPRTVALTGFTADAVIAFDLSHPYVITALESQTTVVTVDVHSTTLCGDLRALAEALATRLDTHDTQIVAWTEKGSDLKSGTTVNFPQPLGPTFGTDSPSGVAVPTASQWGGVLVQASADNGRIQTISAVDDGLFLTAISMAARAVSAIKGEHQPGPVLLKEAQAAGAEFASTESKDHA